MPPLILCPTRFEASHARRVARAVGADLEVIGVGCGCEAAIRRAAAAHPTARVALLVGISGGLRPQATVGQAFLAERVVDERGDTHLPSIHGPWARLPLACSRDVVVGEAARTAAAERTGAAMVDMESGPFARVATALGWRWGVLRGVSDDAARDLPPEVMRWLRPDGGTHWMNLGIDLATRPRLWPAVSSMVRHANAAMRSACGAIGPVLREASR